ncbi:60S acidic ribosomal protein P2, partial [Aspergillus udagawae]
RRGEGGGEGGVRRGHGLRSLRLSAFIYTSATKIMRFGGGAGIWQLFSVWGVYSPIGADQSMCLQAFRMQLRACI